MWKFKKRDAETAEHTRRALHRVGDVVELQVREHGQVQRAQSLDRLGPGRGVELETDLGHAEPRGQPAREAHGLVEIGEVERQREVVADFAVDRGSG